MLNRCAVKFYVDGVNLIKIWRYAFFVPNLTRAIFCTSKLTKCSSGIFDYSRPLRENVVIIAKKRR